MNRNLNLWQTQYDIEKAKGLLHSIERCYLDLEVVERDRTEAEYGINTFYALYDAIEKVDDDIKKLSEDDRLAKAIYRASRNRNLDK